MPVVVFDPEAEAVGSGVLEKPAVLDVEVGSIVESVQAVSAVVLGSEAGAAGLGVLGVVIGLIVESVQAVFAVALDCEDAGAGPADAVLVSATVAFDSD